MTDNTRGFTLLEVMIAVIILGLGITALAGGSMLVTRQVGRGKVVTVATQLATQKMDSLRMLAARAPGWKCSRSRRRSRAASIR